MVLIFWEPRRLFRLLIYASLTESGVDMKNLSRAEIIAALVRSGWDFDGWTDDEIMRTPIFEGMTPGGLYAYGYMYFDRDQQAWQSDRVCLSRRADGLIYAEY